MFTFGDPRLYELTAKDLASGPRIQRFVGTFGFTSAASASVTSTTTFTVPVSVVRILKGVSVIASPGAAQFSNGFQLTSAIAGTFVTAVSKSPNVRVAATPAYYHELIDLVIFPNEVISLLGQFDAGVAANGISGYIWGYDIPRANIAP